MRVEDMSISRDALRLPTLISSGVEFLGRRRIVRGGFERGVVTRPRACRVQDAGKSLPHEMTL